MIIIVIVILVLAILVLGVYNYHIQKKIDSYNNMNERINNLSVLQDFMKIAGEENSVEEKLRKINEIVIEKYNIKYSTIVVFDGAEYVITVLLLLHQNMLQSITKMKNYLIKKQKWVEQNLQCFSHYILIISI